MSDKKTHKLFDLEYGMILFKKAFPEYNFKDPPRFFGKMTQDTGSIRLQEVAFYRHYGLTMTQEVRSNMCVDAFLHVVEQITTVQEFLASQGHDKFQNAPTAWFHWLNTHEKYNNARIFAMIILCRRFLQTGNRDVKALYKYLRQDPIMMQVGVMIQELTPKHEEFAVPPFEVNIRIEDTGAPNTGSTFLSRNARAFIEDNYEDIALTEMDDPDKALQVLLNDDIFKSLRDGSRMVACVLTIVNLCLSASRSMRIRLRDTRKEGEWNPNGIVAIVQTLRLINRFRTLGRYAYEYYLNVTLENEMRTKPPTSGDDLKYYKSGPACMLSIGEFLTENHVGKYLGRLMQETRLSVQDTSVPSPSKPSNHPTSGRGRGKRRGRGRGRP